MLSKCVAWIFPAPNHIDNNLTTNHKSLPPNTTFRSYLYLSPCPNTNRAPINDTSHKTTNEWPLIDQLHNGNLFARHLSAIVVITKRTITLHEQPRLLHCIHGADFCQCSRSVWSSDSTRSGRISTEPWTTVDHAVV